MSWPGGIGRAFVVVAALLSVVNAQAYFGTVADELAECGSNNFVYLGCYPNFLVNAGNTYFQFAPQNYDASNPSRSFPVWDRGTNYNNTMAPLNCAQVCRGYGYHYTALKDNCNCGLQLPTGLTTVADSFCTSQCHGNSLVSCGNGNYAQVYVDPTFADPDSVPISISNPTLALRYKYLGCYSIHKAF
ncbi:hypothetical protein B0H63DRAFT_32257 [Podospora didyma]|uniref:WSC domain-containing protein n=1 Tax=Podospora didyma TaxID=330526 RepID=A0AAE0U858_9PEZI|nr:hypothetical protein B0H63DRAFT_32257 [Podospora didyma]